MSKWVFGQLPEYLFHATYEENLPAIQKYGLGNCKSKKQYAWDNSYKNINHVFLHENIEDAISYAESSDYVPESWLNEIVVIAIKTNNLNIDNLEDDPYLDEPDGSFVFWGGYSF